MSAWSTTPALDRTAQKWRVLAERRHAHLVELYESGRWKRYYTEAQLIATVREAIWQRDRWNEIAPRRDLPFTADALSNDVPSDAPVEPPAADDTPFPAEVPPAA